MKFVNRIRKDVIIIIWPFKKKQQNNDNEKGIRIKI
jgi:hypothetical protein